MVGDVLCGPKQAVSGRFGQYVNGRPSWGRRGRGHEYVDGFPSARSWSTITILPPGNTVVCRCSGLCMGLDSRGGGVLDGRSVNGAMGPS